MLTKGLVVIMLSLCIPILAGCSDEDDTDKTPSIEDSVLGENEPEELDIESIMDGANAD